MQVPGLLHYCDRFQDPFGSEEEASTNVKSFMKNFSLSYVSDKAI